jgi:CheY-like chemotaxis protein
MAFSILVVDDNRDAADSVATYFRLLGYATRTAYDGAEALASAAADPPDAVLLDIALPNADGLEVCRKLRDTLPTGLLLIAMTGWDRPSAREQSRAAGFDHHLVKPIDPCALAAILSGHATDQRLETGLPV